MSFRPALFTFVLFALSASAAPRADVYDEAAQAIRKTIARNAVTLGNENRIPARTLDESIHQTNPVIASDGESFLVVWRESSACCFWNDEDKAPGSLYAVRLNSRGEPAGDPRLVSASALATEPGLAFDGTHYLLLWYELDGSFSRLVGQRFTTEAIPVDVEPFLIGHDGATAGGIGLACGEDDCLTIFRLGSALLSKEIGVLRLDLDSRSERSDVIVTADGYAATLGMRGESVFFPGLPGGSAATYHPAFAEFPRGSLDPIGPFEVSARWQRRFHSLEPGISTSIASNGATIVVAHKEEAESIDGKLFVKRVPANRYALATNDPVLIVPDTVDGRRPMLSQPELLWTGRRFLLVFEKSDDYKLPAPPTYGEVSAVWIAEDGLTIEGPIFNLTSSDEVESRPSLAVNDQGMIALAFIRGLGQQANSTNSRLYVKVLSEGTRSRPARRSGVPAGSSVTLSAEKAGNDRVLLRLTNGSDISIGYNLCGASIDRLDGAQWTDITSGAIVCPAVLLSLPAGESASLERLLIEDITPGTYRFRTFVCTESCVQIASDPIELP